MPCNLQAKFMKCSLFFESVPYIRQTNSDACVDAYSHAIRYTPVRTLDTRTQNVAAATASGFASDGSLDGMK